MNCRPEQIIVGAGNDYLLLLLEKILGRHVGIAMENPTYKRAYRIFESFAYRIHTVDMDDKGMRADRLSGLPVRVAYVMPSHQYPTGAVMTIGRRAELLRWAEREPDRYLIEDDYDSEFRYRGKPIPSLQSSDEKGKVIYIGTFPRLLHRQSVSAIWYCRGICWISTAGIALFIPARCPESTRGS